MQSVTNLVMLRGSCVSVHEHMRHKSRNRKSDRVVQRVNTSSDLLSFHQTLACWRPTKGHKVINHITIRTYNLLIIRALIVLEKDEALRFASALSVSATAKTAGYCAD